MADPAHSVVQPPTIAPVVDKRGYATDAWIKFFASLVSNPPAIEPITLGASPAGYTASHPGNILILGGTVTDITLTRGRTIIDLTGVVSGFIPMGLGDVVAITYSGLPNAWFIPFQ